MVGNIILWTCIIWLPALLYVMLRNETKFKKNIAVGVTIPYVGREDEDVKQRLNRFRKELGWTCLLLTLIAILGFFLRDFALSMTIWCIWVDLVIIIPYVPYIRCNRALKRLKEEKGWKQNGAGTVTVDTSVIPDERWLSPWVFVPTVVLCLLPLLWDRDIWALYVIFSICCGFYWIAYRWLYRNKAEIVDGNSELTRVLTQVRRKNWGNMWLLCGYSFGILSVVISFVKYHAGLQMVILILFVLVITAAALHIEFATRRVQEKLTRDSGKAWYVDEDDKWIGGVIYYNPNDSRTLINDRVGTNSTVNLAKPVGKVLYGFIVLLLVALPFTGVWINSVGNSPLELTLTEETLTAGSYEIHVGEIESVELLEELPDNLIRTMGTGMPSLLKGNFSAPALGRLKVSLDPTCPPYLLVETEGETYLLGSREADMTEDIFNAIDR